MQAIKSVYSKARALIEEIILYWNHPRPGEFVPYKEIVMLSIGWLAQYFVVQFSIGFSVGTAFAGATLGMNNNELLIMNYVTRIIGYLQAPVNTWLTDNLRSKHGKYRVYIRLALPLMLLNLAALWFPYEEVEISKFVMFEINRFSTDFGKKQLELAKIIANAGGKRFYEAYTEAVTFANALPETGNKEEKIWRRQEIRNAHALRKSAKLACKHYPDGLVHFDPQTVEDAYNLPDETSEQQKVRRKAMKKANKEQNLYVKIAAPYLSALRTIRLAEGYENLTDILSDYDDVINAINSEREKAVAEAKKLAEERKLDAERKRAQRKIKNLNKT